MPAKRKALAEMEANIVASEPAAKKTAKSTSNTKKIVNPRARKFKYSNEDTAQWSEATHPWVSLSWPVDDSNEEEEEEEDDSGDSWEDVDSDEVKDDNEARSDDGDPNKPKQDLGKQKDDVGKPKDDAGKPKDDAGKPNDDASKPGDSLTDEMIKKVSDHGFPISECGIQKLQWIIDEQAKRDQDMHRMYVYNDFSGYGTTEMMENLLAEFNKVLFKKDISPFKKWAFIEGLATFLKIGDVTQWMMNDDSEGTTEVLNMIGTMLLTSYEMLAEHSLLGPASTSPIPNIAIISLLMVEFFTSGIDGLYSDKVRWVPEVVRALDKAGVDLNSVLSKEVRVSEEKLRLLRWEIGEKEMSDYEWMAEGWEGRKWTVDDDLLDGERVWAKWDWKLEYAEFKENHPGGNKYNITKWSKREKAQYSFGTM